eukprot:TRINITY_DN13715_c0_g2_i1.p1 TRINITY_DN13715_c0_g2~~TRINITY_DN13715_c0_g2_i1.p1  ORF type:complete len:288 (+),score=61.06 TRINITY_DN13715_c0_g2_i1:217-1080(+)
MSQTTMVVSNPVISSEVQTDEPDVPTPSMAGEDAVVKRPVQYGRDKETQTRTEAPISPLIPTSPPSRILSSANISTTQPVPHYSKQSTTPKAAQTPKRVSSSQLPQLDQVSRVSSSRADDPVTHKKRRSGSPAFFPSAYPEPIPTFEDDPMMGNTTVGDATTSIDTMHTVPIISPAANHTNTETKPRTEAPKTSSPLGAAKQQQHPHQSSSPRRRLSIPAPLERVSTAFSEDSADTMTSPNIHSPHSPVTLPRKRSTVSPVSYTHLRAHETPEHLVCRLLLEKKKKN